MFIWKYIVPLLGVTHVHSQITTKVVFIALSASSSCYFQRGNRQFCNLILLCTSGIQEAQIARGFGGAWQR